MSQALSDIGAWIGRWAGAMAWWQWLLLPAGLALLVAGLFVLAKRRLPGRAGISVSLPSTLAIGLAHAVLGYHCIAWTLPRGVHGPYVGAPLWWAVLLACAGLVGLSLLIDRLEARA